MRKENEPIKIIVDGDDVTNKYDMIVHSRINNCGTKLNIGEQPDLFDNQIVCHRLSITHNRWIGNTGMSSYIVELIEKKETKMNICDECGSLMDGFICLNC